MANVSNCVDIGKKKTSFWFCILFHPLKARLFLTICFSHLSMNQSYESIGFHCLAVGMDAHIVCLT